MRIIYVRRQVLPALILAVLAPLGLLGILADNLVHSLSGPEEWTVFRIRFPAAMDKADVIQKLELVPQIRGTRLEAAVRWLDDRVLEVRLREEGLPKGQRIRFAVKYARTTGYLVRLSVEGEVIPRVQPRLLSAAPARDAPTRGPFQFRFNTMLDKNSFLSSADPPVAGQFFPVRSEADPSQEDTSCWIFRPDERLQNETAYRFVFSEGLSSQGGVPMGFREVVEIHTAPVPVWVRSNPADGSRGVLPFQAVQVENSQPLHQGTVSVVSSHRPDRPFPGRSRVVGRRLVFQPEEVFASRTEYTVEVKGVSAHREETPTFSARFTSADMSGRLWVEVDVSARQRVRVYRGDVVVREMQASTGAPKTPTPLGVYRIRDRGYHFYSYRYREGAFYWVRFLGNYLFHSVPVDIHRNVIPEEAVKLGTPASHGCVRLSLEDARWFYRTIPDGTMVIIHE